MQISKWGNSLAVRLPKKLVQELGLEEGDELDVVAASAQGLALARNDAAKNALERMKSRKWAIPGDYRFDRDEANAR